MRALREEVAGLKAELQEVRRIEYKPERKPEPGTTVIQSSVLDTRSWWRGLWD